MIMAITLAGCSTKAVPGNANEQTGQAGKSTGFFNQEPSDKELFEEALSYLSNKEKEPNYIEGKAKLEKLLTQYPRSRWSATAQALLSGLERIFILEVQLKQEKQKSQNDNLKLTKENETLKDNLRKTEGKYSAEIIRLQQENEQLKKDIQRLKNLEIQLEKREKMLR